MILPNVASLRTNGLRTVSVVCLILTWATQVSSQCPPRPRIPDPPGWAIDRRGGKNIYGYQLSEDGAWFGFNSDGGIWLMNVRTGERKQLLPCVEVSAQTFAFAPDSSLMALGTGNGIIYLFEIPSGALRAELRDDDWVQQIKFGSSRLLLATRTDGISIWNTISLRRVNSFSGGTCDEGGPCVWQSFDGAELSPDGRYLATSGRENSGIVVHDMAGRIALWIRKDVGPYFFLPDNPDILVVLVANEADFWDVASKSIIRRIPHQEFPSLHSIVPGPRITVVEELRSGDDTEDVVRIDLSSGKVLNRWHYAHLLSWISPDGVWATTYNREAIHLPTQRIVGKLEYVPATAHSAPWNVDYGYLAARILKKEAPVYLVITLFLLLGGLGYLICSLSRFSLLAYLASALTLTVWWFRELWWPLHGPPMGRALGAVAVTLTVISIAAAYVLPIWATFGQRPAWKSSVRMLRGLWWGLPLIAASLAGVLACVSIAESEVEKERYQVEGDIRAGGELRGSALLAWDERNPPFEAASAIYGPSYLICNWYQERSELVVLVGTTAAAFLLWLLIAGVFAPPDKRKRLGRVLLAGTLALIELGSAVTLISLYTFNHIFRAYTPTSLLLHRLVWICSIGGTAIWVLIDLRRARAKSELLTDAGYTGGPAPDLGETGAKSRIKCG